MRPELVKVLEHSPRDKDWWHSGNCLVSQHASVTHRFDSMSRTIDSRPKYSLLIYVMMLAQLRRLCRAGGRIAQNALTKQLNRTEAVQPVSCRRVPLPSCPLMFSLLLRRSGVHHNYHKSSAPVLTPKHFSDVCILRNAFCLTEQHLQSAAIYVALRQFSFVSRPTDVKLLKHFDSLSFLVELQFYYRHGAIKHVLQRTIVHNCPPSAFT